MVFHMYYPVLHLICVLLRLVTFGSNSRYRYRPFVSLGLLDWWYHYTPRKPTWQWNIHHLKMHFLLNMGMFQRHVSFQGCTVNTVNHFAMEVHNTWGFMRQVKGSIIYLRVTLFGWRNFVGSCPFGFLWGDKRTTVRIRLTLSISMMIE